MAGSRPARIGDQIRVEITGMLSRQVHDPGIGFLTVTRVEVTADLQHARVYYTTLGDDKARRESARALERAAPFLRRQLAGRLRLRRAPELQFYFDESVEQHDRIERILREIQDERATAPIAEDAPADDAAPPDPAAENDHLTGEPTEKDSPPAVTDPLPYDRDDPD
jgi:ribosome-binding factor A